MRSCMGRRTVFFILGFALAVSCAQAAPTDVLWQKAIKVAEAAKTTLPGIIQFRAEMMDGDGTVESIQESTVKLTEGKDGQVESELVKVIEDGRDVTQKARDEESRRAQNKSEKGEGQSFGIQFGDNPFQPEVQTKVTARSLGTKRTLLGRPCSEFEVTWKKDKETEKGIACLDDQTGAPLEYSYVPDPLPKHVKRMQTTLRYEDGGPSGWRPTEMKVEGEGGFLFIRKKFRMRTTFSEFWRASQLLAPSGAKAR